MNPTAQQWPHKINYEINGSNDSAYLIISNSGGGSDDAGGDCILGQSFLERFYAVFDTSKSSAENKYTSSVGLAFAPWTFDK